MELLTLPTLIGFAVLGTGAGAAAGLLGIGGGVILVPLFLWSFQLIGIDAQVVVHSAFATSLATIIPTAVSNTWGHNKLGNVCRRHVLFLAIGAVIGAVSGAWIASLLSGGVLKMAFGVMQLAVAAKLLLGKQPEAHGERREGSGLLLFTGFVGGLFSSFFGIGGGVIAVPLMVLLLRFPMHLAVGNSSALIIVSSLMGTCSYVFLGWGELALKNGFCGYVFLPAVLMVVPFALLGSRIGVSLAGRFSQRRMIRIFALLLIFVGIRMILRAG